MGGILRFNSRKRKKGEKNVTVDRLYERYYDELLRFAAGICHERSRAEDAVQEAFLRAMRHIRTLCGLTDGQRRAWLYKAVRSCAVDEIRRAAKLPVEAREESVEDDLSGPWIEQAMETLSEAQRRLVRMRYLEGFNSTEIGVLAGLPAPTVRTRLRAAIRILKKYCDGEENS